MAPIKVAVLDDYQGLADEPFSKLDSSKFEVTSLKDTLRPYNHADTGDEMRDELVKRLEPYEVISTMRERTPFPAQLINRLPKLKFLLTTARRNLSLDLDAFKARNIPVTGTTAHPTSKGPDSTTQHCITMILSLMRNIAQDDLAVKTGAWQTTAATSTTSKTLGIVGLGRLGTNIAKIMHIAFGMKVITWSTNLTQERADEQAKESGLPIEDSQGNKTFKVVTRDELFSKSDVISIHLVLSDRSRGNITSSDLVKMKPTSFLVNTSRGPLIVEKALLECIKAGKIAGVAFDVFDIEPLPADSEWRNPRWGKDGTSRVLLTPHMGYVDDESLTGWYEQQVENIKRWAAGEQLENVMV